MDIGVCLCNDRSQPARIRSPMRSTRGTDGAVHKKFLLAALLVGTLTAGCDTSSTPNSTAATTPPVIVVTPSAPGTSGGASASAPAAQQSAFPVATTPIPGTAVSSIVQAWAAQWHATPKQYVVQGVHSSRLTVDFPSAHGRLFMSVGQLSPEATAASNIYCSIDDASLGQTRFLTLTRTAVQQFVADCAGSVLKGGETKQVIDYVASHDKPDAAYPCKIPGTGGTCRFSDNRVDLDRFRLVVQTVPGQVRMYLLGRKAAA